MPQHVAYTEQVPGQRDTGILQIPLFPGVHSFLHLLLKNHLTQR